MWSNTRAQQTRWGVVAGVVLLLMTFVVFSAHRSTAGRSGAAIPTATASDLAPDQHKGPPAGTPVYQYPPGVPAIAVKTTTGPGPNFTPADVKAFVATYTMTYQTPGSAPLQVVSVEFLTSAAAHQKLTTDTARPPQALMCLVYVHGDFTINPGLGGSSAHATEGWLLFDAVTGNLLIEAS
jgi:hypothetical protein